MKLLDKFLKLLKTDRNTFFTYIFTLLTAYILVDRIIELIFLCFTGVSINYWGPLAYTFALLCPALAFGFSYPSKFAKSDNLKLSFFYSFWIAFYIIGISMFIQWLNRASWIGVLALPNANAFLTTFATATKRAFSVVPIYIILMTFYKLFFWLYKIINDPIFPSTYKESILDYTGIDLTPTPENSGPYSFEVAICTDRTTGKPVNILERRRLESTLIVGPTGTGKSAMVMEPMMARDIEKKYFLLEASKQFGFDALKSGLATLNCPYDNEYLNNNFSPNMLKPVDGKEKSFNSHMKKLIYATTPDGKIVYKNFGFASLTPDFEQTKRIAEVAKNFGIHPYVIDPCDPNSPGLNPFMLNNPNLSGLIISLVTEDLFNARSATAELAYMKDVAYQAIQNICIFLAEMYPRRHNGDLPTLEDVLHCLVDFDKVEALCEDLKTEPELAKQYDLQIAYFEQHFYKKSTGREQMQRIVHFGANQLEELLRAGQVRNIICNRNPRENINFYNALANGDIVLIASRPSEIGGTPHAGFGKFFLTLLMCYVEGRPGNEKTRTPYFVYVDEFNRYASGLMGDMINIYRKFKVGTIFAIPNLESIGGTGNEFSQTLLSNASTKISFGNCTPEDYGWWEKEFGQRREWKRNNAYNMSKGEYGTDLGGVDWEWKDHMKIAKIQGLKFKNCIYKTKDKKGKNVVNFATVDFMDSKYNEPHKVKNYNFDKFNNGNSHHETASNDKTKHSKFNPDYIDFDEDIDPVQTDTTDSSVLFNNEDAVSFNLNNKRKSKK